jgi:hypothetical protein
MEAAETWYVQDDKDQVGLFYNITISILQRFHVQQKEILKLCSLLNFQFLVGVFKVAVSQQNLLKFIFF